MRVLLVKGVIKKKMKTILICNQKGGVGKTLIADELAFALERDGIPYSFYDLDEQGSAIHKTVNNPDAEVQVVDTPGALQEDLIKWVDEADMVIVPTMMSNRDTKPLMRMIEILAPYEEKGKPVLYIFNRWNRWNITRQFIDWFQAKYPDLHTAILTDTVEFGMAGSYGVSIYEFKKSSIGTRQMGEIYGIVKYHLNIREKWRTGYIEKEWQEIDKKRGGM